MNWEQIEGMWTQVKGTVREKWGSLTDDDLELIAGRKDRLLGKLQERYGLAKEAAERELDQLVHDLEEADGGIGAEAERGRHPR